MLPSYDTQYAPNLILQHGSTTYDYDFLGQLIGADYANAGISDESYTYDSNGNRITANGSTYTTSTNNELTSDGVWSYTYDDEGNRISKQNSTNRELYTWDYRNRLTSVTQQEFNAETQEWTTVQIVEYTYDYNNVWIRKIIGNEKTIFIPENYQTTVQIDNNTVSHHYLWTPNQQDKLHADTTSSDILWSLTDHLGTIRDIIQSTATRIVTQAHVIYDAYGNIISCKNPAGETVENPILFAYTGKAFDASTSLQNNINRWYDSTVGRWLSTDPIAFNGGDTNLYRYCSGKPVITTDLLGLAPSSKTSAGYWELKDKTGCCQEVTPVEINAVWVGEPEGYDIFLDLKDVGNPLKVTDVNDMLDKIDNAVNQCQCIQKLTILTHGASTTKGGFKMTDFPKQQPMDWISGINQGRRFGEALKGIMCKPCYINVMACYGGTGDTIKAIARETGCTVRGITQGVLEIYPNDGWWWEADAEWITKGDVIEYDPLGNRSRIFVKGSTGQKIW